MEAIICLRIVSSEFYQKIVSNYDIYPRFTRKYYFQFIQNQIRHNAKKKRHKVSCREPRSHTRVST
jgi:hypothetical protein